MSDIQAICAAVVGVVLGIPMLWFVWNLPDAPWERPPCKEKPPVRDRETEKLIQSEYPE